MITEKTYSPVLRLTLTAGESLPAFRFVNFAGNLCGANERAFGVTDYSALAGELVSIIVIGTALVECDSSVTGGEKIASAGTGKAKLYESGESNGIALKSVTDGLATILLK